MFNILQSITGFTVFHGFILFILLSLRKTNQKTQNELKYIILAFSIYIGEFLLVITKTIVQFPHLILVSFPLIFCVGPLFLIFAQKTTFTFHKRTYLWLFSPLIFYLLFIPFFQASPSFKLSILNDFDQLATTYPIVHFFASTSLPFNLFTLFFLWRAHHTIRYKAPQTKQTHLIKRFLLAFIIGIVVIILISLIVFVYPNLWLRLILFLQPFLFALGLHFLGYWLIFTPELARPLVKSEKNSYLKSPLPSEYKHKYVKRIQQLFTDTKPFLQNDFSAEAMANLLGISKHYLSQILSQELQTSFSDLINQYRIAEACAILQTQESPVIQNIALEVGYNNKVSFYRAFKKITQQTPSEFMAEKSKNSA